MKLREYDMSGVPDAANVQVMLCSNPECGRLHLVMVDSDDKPIAVATPARNEDMLELLAQAKNLMEQINASRWRQS